MDRKITNKNGEVDHEIMTDNIINYSVCEITIMTDAGMIINNIIGKIEIRMEKIINNNISEMATMMDKVINNNIDGIEIRTDKIINEKRTLKNLLEIPCVKT